MPELSPFSVLDLSLFSRPSLALLSLPPLHLSSSFSLSLYLSAHLRAGFSRQTMHRATPSKTSTSLVAAMKKRKREGGTERTELSTPVRKFISETKSSQRTDSGTSIVALKFSGYLVRSCGAMLVLIYLLNVLNLSNNIKSY